MPEYLAPGVYGEEVSYRSKSIEGVSTTTTGFVGPARYGPTEIEPDVLTSLLDFERVYGDHLQLVWNGDQYHNYLWHAVRAFFEEGGKRVYVARVFRPLTGEDGDTETAVYNPPAPALKDDRARRSVGKLYEHDGHARLWLTRETAAMRSVARKLQEVLGALDTTQGQSALAKQRAENAARTAKDPNGDSSGTSAAALRSAEKARDLFSIVRGGFAAVQQDAASVGSTLPAGTLPDTLLVASSGAIEVAGKAVAEAALRVDGAITPATAAEAVSAAEEVIKKLRVILNTSNGSGAVIDAVNKATEINSKIPGESSLKAVFQEAQRTVSAVRDAMTGVPADAANTAAQNAQSAYQENENGESVTMYSTAKDAEDAAITLEKKVNAVVTAAMIALDQVRKAETQSKAVSELSKEVRDAIAASSQAAEVLLNSAQEAAVAAQAFRAKASGALARAQVAQELISKLKQVVSAANNAYEKFNREAGEDPEEDPGGAAVQVGLAQAAIDAAAASSDTGITPNVKSAIGLWQTAFGKVKGSVEAAAAFAQTAKEDQLVEGVYGAVTAAKAALDNPLMDNNTRAQLVRVAKEKVTQFSGHMEEWKKKAGMAVSLLIPSSTLESEVVKNFAPPSTIPEPISDAQTAVGAATTSITNAKLAIDEVLLPLNHTVDLINAMPDSFTTAAVQAAADSAHGAVSKLEELEQALRTAEQIIRDQENHLAETTARFAGAAIDEEPPQEPHEAVLLRARFPGAYGNLAIRFSLRLGDNLLRGTPGKAKAAGLQEGDFVWIGTQAALGTTMESGKLLLATRDEQAKEWRFGPDAEKKNLQHWLNGSGETPEVQLDPAKHFLRVATIAVTVDSGDSTPGTWEGLAPQPTHTRAGAPDSLTAKFSPEPASAADARMLPIVILADDSLNTAGALFKTLFGRLDTTLELPQGQDRLEVEVTLVGGNDGQRPGAGEYEGIEKEHGKTGLKALEDLDDIAIVAAPGATYGLNDGYRKDAESILGLTISHAERMRYRIAVLDSGNNQTIGEVRATCAKLDSKYAALYYPWVKVLDPVTRKEIFLPPSGFVTGIYARNDITRAVYKAPANEVVNLALGFEITLNKSQQDVLNPLGINCFRYFPGRGHRLWGARTLSSDPEWKYVNLRRYFAYVEHSIDKSTQWAVFEPNGERLWDNVRRTIYDFLLNEWQNGALLGEKPEKAFFVRCDRSTMTQNDLDNGRLVCMIGIAPLRPAEYVIFRIGQWTADRKA